MIRNKNSKYFPETTNKNNIKMEGYFFSSKDRKRHSNVLDLCFWDAECIRKREEREQRERDALFQQQQLLMGISGQKSGGLSTGAVVAIVFSLIAITAGTIYFIKKRKK